MVIGQQLLPAGGCVQGDQDQGPSLHETHAQFGAPVALWNPVRSHFIQFSEEYRKRLQGICWRITFPETINRQPSLRLTPR
jgi:hypothetical protein